MDLTEGEFIVSKDDLLLSFPQLQDKTLYGHLTDVTKIESTYDCEVVSQFKLLTYNLDMVDKSTTPPTLSPWTFTDPAIGNKWRQKADGVQCLAFPIWLYCDDTSGNTSKRWNEHNSFLFTAAGLDRTESSKEYNVHFLATSNTAPPLEMLDGIADQLQDCQENGIWSWDPKTHSCVLLIVCVLALLGDNPMQSEFACHIGLRGKFFCRTCWAKGKDAKDGPTVQNPIIDEDTNDEEHEGSETGSKKTRAKFKESLQSMIHRVKGFVKPGKPCTKAETMATIKSQFITAETKGTSKAKEARTESGIKDTYQVFFIDKFMTRRRKGVQEAQAPDLSQDIMSPVWRIKGLDPHADTPVEILHVVLLGFVKYLWRDVIENQLKKNEKLKRELATRLSSLDVQGLGLDSSFQGEVLVNHYGSLTGSDFRKISQAAPFVLKEFVVDDCYQTWVALSKLVPLIWQPKIVNLNSYIELLQQEIEQFLLYAAQWSIRWFNKPKFHILVHLPEHIRRFGPAMLFATEVFESYNAVIRAKSIHSNRLAPSRDIAWAFARQNRIRHMLSSGVFLDRGKNQLNKEADERFGNTNCPQKDRVTQVQQYFRSRAFTSEHWVTVGQRTGTVDRGALDQQWQNTQTGRLVPETPLYTEFEKSTKNFHRTQQLIVANGDKCKPLGFAACSSPLLHAFSIDSISIVKVIESLQCKRTAFPTNAVDSVLVEAMVVGKIASSHGMPRLTPSGRYFSIPPTAIVLTEKQSLQCTVNVQHDCNRHRCAVEAKQPAAQEREQTSKLKDEVVHKGDLNDKVLNTAQMRDADFLQRFRIQVPQLSMDVILEESSAREWNALNRSTTKALQPLMSTSSHSNFIQHPVQEFEAVSNHPMAHRYLQGQSSLHAPHIPHQYPHSQQPYRGFPAPSPPSNYSHQQTTTTFTSLQPQPQAGASRLRYQTAGSDNSSSQN
ncbi:hypothetical protein F5876DRAFT_53309 [Lentinula aff. lateritia]|uniref:Uncharacterized protein n=1 Tax=Lentinula aff. lateritia TaxID=2804960 RepID=A0ACC1TIQ3_9AGAR|nr:hypothetical protein F5876DRAFT_53309 [Lentinula aff. lateritia]